MLAAVKLAVSERERLESVLLEALPLDATRLREWRVWLAFWAESMNDSKLANENARRYTEWQDLLLTLVAPLVGSAKEAREVVADLIALSDGLGLRMARSSEGEGVI